MDEQDELLTAKEAAKIIMLKEKTLRNWRSLRIGPPHVKRGGRVFYRAGDLEEFREQHTYTCTNQYGRKPPLNARPATSR